MKYSSNVQYYILENFENYCLHHYLNFGLRSMSKTDTETFITLMCIVAMKIFFG